MIILAGALIFLFGLVIGSFLNVVIFRYNTGRGLGGRSGCMTCGRELRWHELIPVVSFLAQGGKCRTCKSKLSWQYPAVELLTGILFVFTFLNYSGGALSAKLFMQLAVMLVAWCLLVVILIYDLRHKIIPDGLAYAFAGLGLVNIFLTVPFQSFLDFDFNFYFALLSGPMLFAPFFLLWIGSGGKWIGLGDGKLALGIGWMLGPALGVSAIFLAFWIGAAVSVLLMVIMRLKSAGKQLTMKSEIPFAPYLILGFAIAYFFSLDVLGLGTLLGL